MTADRRPAEVITAATERRVIAAIYDADVSRSLIEHDWPECHKNKCQARHGDPDSAFFNMKARIAESVKLELGYRTTTQPDVAEPDDSPYLAATSTLAVLLSRYTTGTQGDAGTFMRAAELLIGAYPGMVAAINGDDS